MVTDATTRWERLADAPTARLEVAAAVVDGLIHVAGGLDAGGGTTARVEIYDPSRNAWSAGPDLPIAIHHAMGVAWRGRFVVLGGFTDGGFSQASSRAFALGEDGWTELPALRRARAAGGAAVVGNRIYVVGGQGGGGLISQVERFDGRVWRDRTPLPTPRDHLGVATDGRSIFAVGGRRLSIESAVPVLERYEPRRDRWERLADAPTARGGIGVGVVSGKLLVVGGEGRAGANADGVYSQVETFSIGAQRWERLKGIEMPSPRHGVGAVTIGPTLYVAVGGPRLGGSASATFEALVNVVSSALQ